MARDCDQRDCERQIAREIVREIAIDCVRFERWREIAREMARDIYGERDCDRLREI